MGFFLEGFGFASVSALEQSRAHLYLIMKRLTVKTRFSHTKWSRLGACMVLAGSILSMASVGDASASWSDAGLVWHRDTKADAQRDSYAAQPEESGLADHDSLWRSFGGVRAITKPSRDAVMGFTLSTRVTEVLVEGGQRVHEGDLLIRGDDSADVAEAAFQRARAETPLPRKRAESKATLAKLEYERLLQAEAQGGANPLDIERARAAEQAAAIDLQLAILNEVLASHQADAAEARVAKLSLGLPLMAWWILCKSIAGSLCVMASRWYGWLWMTPSG